MNAGTKQSHPSNDKLCEGEFQPGQPNLDYPFIKISGRIICIVNLILECLVVETGTLEVAELS